MGWYLLKLAIILPLIGAMIWGSLRLLKRVQGGIGQAGGTARRVRVVETLMLSPTQRLAVLEFGNREILVGASRNGLVRLGEGPLRNVEAGE